MEKIAVIGLGMLGCSLCASLEGTCVRLGWGRRPEVGKWARETGLIEEDCPSVEAALQQADLAVLCLPIPVIMEYLHTYAALMKKTLVTDIGSVKGCIVRAAEENGVRFVGSHPMAGTEKSGPESLVRGIYAGATVFIVPSSNASEADAAQVESMWRKVHAVPRRLDAKEHDRLVANTSHVPHVVSCALALSVLGVPESGRELRFAGCASGFRDTVRVAASSPKMWREILSHNQEAVLEAMEFYEERCAYLKKLIADGDFDGFEREFARGKALIEEWRRSQNRNGGK
ncbi:MAG: prephenate dehydrogenase [Lentisphaeria bacterium]|nr:prephenate dehydrogenase [Lentisphaeria bacterium]